MDKNFGYVHNKDGDIIAHFIDISLPGYSKDNVSVEAKGDSLVIKSDGVNNSSDTYTYINKSIYTGEFILKYNLDEDRVDVNNISAKFSNGILHIEVPSKKKSIKSKFISIS